MRALITLLLALGAGVTQAASIEDLSGAVSGEAAVGGLVHDFSDTGIPVFGEAISQLGDHSAYAFGSVEFVALAAGVEALGGTGFGTATLSGTIAGTGVTRLVIDFESIILTLGPDADARTQYSITVTQNGDTLIAYSAFFYRSEEEQFSAILHLANGLTMFTLTVSGQAQGAGTSYATASALASVGLAQVPLPAAIYGLLAALASFVPFARRRVAGV